MICSKLNDEAEKMMRLKKRQEVGNIHNNHLLFPQLFFAVQWEF
jgi:hypothetical protein